MTIWEAGWRIVFRAARQRQVQHGLKSSTIPDQIVGRDGSISVPYAGRIKVAGRTTQEVQGIVEHALAGKAIEPQVLINMPKSVSNSVTVTGEVVNGARVPLSVRGDRVMDVIATAGGIRAPVNETYVQLSRGQETVRVAMSRVSSDPKENIYLRPNDVLTLIRDPQTFIAYGATGKNAEIPFDAEGISLSQARQGRRTYGFPFRPAGVFIFRFEPESVVRALAPGSTLAAHNRVTPVVYRLNLRDAASLFIARGFRIQNRDLLYVSNAPITDAEKVMQIVSMISSPALTGLSACAYIKC